MLDKQTPKVNKDLSYHLSIWHKQYTNKIVW